MDEVKKVLCFLCVQAQQDMQLWIEKPTYNMGVIVISRNGPLNIGLLRLWLLAIAARFGIGIRKHLVTI